MVSVYCPRRLSAVFEEALARFPAVLVTGPRQSGKTTFLREEWGEGAHYVTFDDPLERDFARTDPNGFLDRFAGRQAILDEIQYVPELLSYLKIRIDADRHSYGRWLLTGSQQLQLMANVSESLAGRIALLELLPFSLLELPERPSLENLLWNGAYPEPALEPEKRDLWVSSYLRTYVERDVRQIHNIQDLALFASYLALCAARHGQEMSWSDVARSVGIAQPTAKTWSSVLEAAYVTFLVRPYFENFGKRIIKTPKIYFLDPALVVALTRQSGAAAALAGAQGGSLFEGWVLAEAYKVFTLHGKRADLYFWRSHDQLEVDLLLPLGGRLQPVEIKLTATPTRRHVEPLRRFQELAGDAAAETGLLVCRTPEPRPLPGGALALPWWEFPAWLDARLSESG
jgi:hypothetical protein